MKGRCLDGQLLGHIKDQGRCPSICHSSPHGSPQSPPRHPSIVFTSTEDEPRTRRRAGGEVRRPGSETAGQRRWSQGVRTQMEQAGRVQVDPHAPGGPLRPPEVWKGSAFLRMLQRGSLMYVCTHIHPPGRHPLAHHSHTQVGTRKPRGEPHPAHRHPARPLGADCQRGHETGQGFATVWKVLDRLLDSVYLGCD